MTMLLAILLDPFCGAGEIFIVVTHFLRMDLHLASDDELHCNPSFQLQEILAGKKWVK